VSAPELKLDYCGLDAAKFAVEHWHYSERLPSGKLVKVGVWEGGQFIGCVLYGDGANKDLLAPYGLKYEEGCELVRIALRAHHAPVTRIVSIAMKLLKRACPGLRLVVSFADPEQGHHGGIYQAGNWVYAGKSGAADEYILAGKRIHGRSLRAKRAAMGMTNSAEKNVLEWAQKYVSPRIRMVSGSQKYRYLYALDAELRRKIQSLALEAPKRKSAAKASCDVPGDQLGEGGSTPTSPLQPSSSEAR
jgi:hypothetical protein